MSDEWGGPWEEYNEYRERESEEPSLGKRNENTVIRDVNDHYQRFNYIRGMPVSRKSKKMVNHTPGRWWDTEITQSKKNSMMDKKQTTEALCSKVKMTRSQRRKAVGLILGLNLDKFGNQKRISKIALAVIKYVVEKDRSEKYPKRWIDDPSELRMSSNEEYTRLVEEQGLEMNDMMRLSGKVKKEISRLKESGSLFL